MFSAKKTCPPGHVKNKTRFVSEFVAWDLLPMSIVVDRIGFVKLMNFLNPGYTVPSRTRYSNHATTTTGNTKNIIGRLGT